MKTLSSTIAIIATLTSVSVGALAEGVEQIPNVVASPVTQSVRPSTPEPTSPPPPPPDARPAPPTGDQQGQVLPEGCSLGPMGVYGAIWLGLDALWGPVHPAAA
jgi:hypothetical protein